MMVKIGTSGYDYFWNQGNPTKLQWYIKQGFNTVEINSTFYRFPTTDSVNAWLKTPEYFDFTIKVHRSITHYARLSERGIQLLEKFMARLKRLEGKISFWLFQMPPSFSYNEKNVERMINFLRATKLKARPVIEFRESEWWQHKEVLNGLDCVFCSVDAPGLPNDIVNMNNIVYIRLHGREEWYSYEYSEGELVDILERALKVRPTKCYIYLNNDHGMLPNGLYLLEKVSKNQMSRQNF